MDVKFSSSQLYVPSPKKANHMQCIKDSTSSQLREVIVHSALCCFSLTSSSECSFVVPQNRKELECVQRREMSMMKGLKSKIYEEQLNSLVFFQLGEEKAKEGLRCRVQLSQGGKTEGVVLVYSPW